MIIDYSAHSKFDTCPGAWFETYVNRRTRKWPSGLRDDALCLGSLFHGGMEVWKLTGTIGIPPEILEEASPDQKTFQLAQELIWGYTQAYPHVPWTEVRCEEPLIFPIEGELQGLAKVDCYFKVEEDIVVPGGLGGQELTLTPGWWIDEYKTKSPFIPIGLYLQNWETNLQPSYQTLALREHLGEPVQGILINVIEKPRRHIPKRKCRRCKESIEFAAWLPTGTGLYCCPDCGSKQELTPLKEAPSQSPPAYYRILVRREGEQLERDREIIRLTGLRMMEMEKGGLHSQPWNKGNCVNFQYKKPCEYFSSHLYGRDTREDEEYETRKDYRGLVTIEGGN
jgi:hypothetical protein